MLSPIACPRSSWLSCDRLGRFALWLCLCLVAFTVGCSSGPCSGDQSDCTGQCYSLRSDPAHCGSCTNACAGAQVCSAGSCSDSCGAGLINCARQCVDLNGDNNNCGACGTKCANGATCQAGKCTGGVTPVCDSRLSLQTSGTWDADVKVVRVSGKLTKNGAALSPGNRGSLVFVGKDGGARAGFVLPNSGDASYGGDIFTGTYDIFYQSSNICSDTDPLPCQRALLMAGAQVSAAGVLDLDAKTVTVSGKLTKNGARVPDDTSDRGALVFTLVGKGDVGGTRTLKAFPLTGEATYSGELFQGSYDIRLQSGSYCREGGALPCMSSLLAAGRTLQNSGVLDFDVKTVNVSGRLTKNGARVPDDSSSDRGALTFNAADGGVRYLKSFSATGDAAYSGELYVGTYDIRYRPSIYCREGGALPCQGLVLQTRRGISASGVLDLDAKTVTVSGRVTKNGATVPDDANGRGLLVFTLDSGDSRSLPSFKTTGEATYSGEVFAGTYDVRYASSTYCRDGGALPCMSQSLLKGKAVAATGVLDFDLKTVTVSGRVTKNGAVVPDDPNDRGGLVFQMTGGGGTRALLFKNSGDATYTGELFAGSYDVRYQPGVYCRESGALPCQWAPLVKDKAIGASGVLDYDLKTVTVSGRLTKNGAVVPDDPSDRGGLAFSLYEGGARNMPSFTATGPATYSGEVFAGKYDIRYRSGIYCRDGGALPCQGLLLVGCPPTQ